MFILFFPDKFDQFWAVNRRLMEVNPLSSARASTPTTNTNSPTSIEESNAMKTFKHIPIRYVFKFINFCFIMMEIQFAILILF